MRADLWGRVGTRAAKIKGPGFFGTKRRFPSLRHCFYFPADQNGGPVAGLLSGAPQPPVWAVAAVGGIGVRPGPHSGHMGAVRGRNVCGWSGGAECLYDGGGWYDDCMNTSTARKTKWLPGPESAVGPVAGTMAVPQSAAGSLAGPGAGGALVNGGAVPMVKSARKAAAQSDGGPVVRLKTAGATTTITGDAARKVLAGERAAAAERFRRSQWKAVMGEWAVVNRMRSRSLRRP